MSINVNGKAIINIGANIGDVCEELCWRDGSVDLTDSETLSRNDYSLPVIIPVLGKINKRGFRIHFVIFGIHIERCLYIYFVRFRHQNIEIIRNGEVVVLLDLHKKHLLKDVEVT